MLIEQTRIVRAAAQTEEKPEMSSESQSDERQKHDKKDVTIVVNGTEETVPKGDVTFDQIVAFGVATGLPTGPNILYTITYRRAEGQKPEGNLVQGGTAKVRDGTVFNVTATDKS
jgi:hypothetical protein